MENNNNNNKEQSIPFKLNSPKRSRRSECLVKSRLFADENDDADAEIDEADNEIDVLAERLGMCSLGKTFEHDSDSGNFRSKDFFKSRVNSFDSLKMFFRLYEIVEFFLGWKL